MIKVLQGEELGLPKTDQVRGRKIMMEFMSFRVSDIYFKLYLQFYGKLIQ